MAVKSKATNQATIDSKPQDINNFIPKLKQVGSDYGYGMAMGAEFPLIRNIGFDTISCIFELIDNSIDAEATKIYVSWIRGEDGLYTLKIKDNGMGVPGGEKRVEEVFTQLGVKEQYLINRTGHYGIGAKATLINLLLDGTATIITTHKGLTTTFKITHTLDNKVEKLIGSYQSDEDSGTSIVIPGIKSKLQVERLVREISCVYYPNTENYDDFSIIVNDKEIDFVDPLYRHLNGNTDGKFVWDRRPSFNFI